MSVSLMTAVWSLDLPTTDKMVLLALADAANDDGVTWIAVKSRRQGKADLLAKCSLSERAVQGAIKRLCDGGYLARSERPGKGVIYTVTPAAGAPPQQVRPAANDADPRSRCGETVSNHHIPSEANASSGERARNRKPRPSRRCPEGWTPTDADMATAAALGFSPGQIERELATLRDFEFRTPRSDWSATFRNWMRREAKAHAPANDHHAANRSTAFDERLRAIDDAMAAAVGAGSG